MNLFQIILMRLNIVDGTRPVGSFFLPYIISQYESFIGSVALQKSAEFNKLFILFKIYILYTPIKLNRILHSTIEFFFMEKRENNIVLNFCGILVFILELLTKFSSHLFDLVTL